MEIEMKYAIKDKDTARSIWEDESLLGMEEKGSREKVYMKAAYFDTDDYILSKNDIAFRVRMEGPRIVASLKWNGASEKGMHTREEINVPVKDEACFIAPDPEIFRESEDGREMLALVGGKTLRSFMETRFLRSRVRIDTGKSICEVAVDEGEIVTDFGTQPICELEIELFSGDKEDIRRIGEALADKHWLIEEPKSKYARGLLLLEKTAGRL